MVEGHNLNDTQGDVTLQSDDAPAKGRRPYESPKLVSGDIFERMLMTSAPSPAPGVPGC